MSEEFPFKKDIEALFENHHQPLTLDVTINAEDEPVRRRHGAALKFSEERTGAFVELEPIRVPAPDCDKDAAIGWIAHTSYLGAIPKDLGVRGIRLREGNIQIGEENALDNLFREERFNRWCVGEIHVVDARLLPNGRRDYFEPGPHMRQIENHLESIIQSVVHRCRNASSARNQQRKMQTRLEQMDGAYELAASGYLKAGDAKALVERVMQRMQTLEESLDPTDPAHENKITEIARLRAKLSKFRPKRGRPPMGKVPQAENRDLPTSVQCADRTVPVTKCRERNDRRSSGTRIRTPRLCGAEDPNSQSTSIQLMSLMVAPTNGGSSPYDVPVTAIIPSTPWAITQASSKGCWSGSCSLAMSRDRAGARHISLINALAALKSTWTASVRSTPSHWLDAVRPVCGLPHIALTQPRDGTPSAEILDVPPNQLLLHIGLDMHTMTPGREGFGGQRAQAKGRITEHETRATASRTTEKLHDGKHVLPSQPAE